MNSDNNKKTPCFISFSVHSKSVVINFLACESTDFILFLATYCVNTHAIDYSFSEHFSHNAMSIFFLLISEIRVQRHKNKWTLIELDGGIFFYIMKTYVKIIDT